MSVRTPEVGGGPASSPEGVGIACRSVTAGYLGSKVLQNVSFTIDKPAIYVVLGPNGAGKTTLFRTLSGILRPYEGEVSVGGVAIEHQGARNQMHYLSHLEGIPDSMRVRDALEFYARVERATPADVDRVLDLLELRELAGQYIAKLSAGQRKRVSVARVFLRERAIYLLDEPTANLDPKLAREIRSLILDLSRDKIVMYSSHNLYEAREIGEYVLAIKAGRLTLFDRIENLKSARFVVGIRVLEPSEALAGFPREGDYFLRELSGPDQVPALLRDLESRGVKIRELREMNNPLEELFA